MNVNTDKFLKVGQAGQNPVTAKITVVKQAGSNSAICDSLVGWPVDTPVTVSIYETQIIGNRAEPVEGSQTDWVAEVSNNSLINMKLTAGVDRDYDTINTVVTLNNTVELHNRLVEGILKSHNQDGTIKASTVGRALVDIFYPVGSIFQTTVETDMSTKFPGTTWERITDRFLYAGGDNGEYKVGKTFGEDKHQLTLAEMPEHYHDVRWNSPDGSGMTATVTGNGSKVLDITALNWNHNYNNNSSAGANIMTNKVGGNQPHNNMPPALSVYTYKRIA